MTKLYQKFYIQILSQGCNLMGVCVELMLFCPVIRSGCIQEVVHPCLTEIKFLRVIHGLHSLSLKVRSFLNRW